MLSYSIDERHRLRHLEEADAEELYEVVDANRVRDAGRRLETAA